MLPWKPCVTDVMKNCETCFRVTQYGHFACWSALLVDTAHANASMLKHKESYRVGVYAKTHVILAQYP